MKNRSPLMLGLPLAMALAIPVLAQNPEQTNPQQNTPPSPPASQSVDAAPDQNVRQPLKLETKEGFWGKLNPFARKKYVQRQMAPVQGRVNELDELTAGNTKMLRDVDSRATEGIRMASLKANEADAKAIEAGNRASMAHQTATQATEQISKVEKSVSNLDQYQTVSEAEIRFRPGQLALSDKAKAALDELATPLKQQKGYVLEVQGFSSGQGRTAMENSQRLAESVVRYLVLQHDIPIHRIYTVGMGNVPPKAAADGQKPRRTRGGRVEISLLHNSLANMQATNAAPQQQQ
jgi:outer membrane protein OmpA-like peptidoglycan-associated protein